MLPVQKHLKTEGGVNGRTGAKLAGHDVPVSVAPPHLVFTCCTPILFKNHPTHGKALAGTHVADSSKVVVKNGYHPSSGRPLAGNPVQIVAVTPHTDDTTVHPNVMSGKANSKSASGLPSITPKSSVVKQATQYKQKPVANASVGFVAWFFSFLKPRIAGGHIKE